jgi:predicted phage gp36 major capsid-like protein
MSLSHRKQLTAEQYEAMIAMRTDDLEKAEAEIERLAEQYVFEKTHRETCEAETQSLQRRIEELELAVCRSILGGHKLTECKCVHCELLDAVFDKYLSPKEQP